MLRWRNLRLQFSAGASLALPDGSLSPGDVLVLLGPSGCGKSSLLRVFLGELEPSGGEVRVGDALLSAVVPAQRPALFAVLRQENGLLPDEGALTNCLVGEYHEEDPMGRARARLTEVGVAEEIWGRPVTRLSGGQQRRVALARCLVLERPVRVFDEPTTGLDPENVARVGAVLSTESLWEASCGLVVTHDEAFAERVGTVIGRVSGGTVDLVRVRPPRSADRASKGIPGDRPIPGRRQVFYGPGWVFSAETRRLTWVVAPLLAVSSYIIGATLLAQSLGFANVPFTRFVDMPRTILETVLRGLLIEVVPLVAGLLFAGIGGAAIAGKTATLATTGVLDTFRWMGRRPERLFGTPAVAASAVYLPLILLLCAGASVMGAGTVLALGGLPLGAAALGPVLRSALAGQEVAALFTLVKSVVFALVVSVTGFAVGVRARGGAEAIAQAAALAVLIASLAVVVANAVLTFII